MIALDMVILVPLAAALLSAVSGRNLKAPRWIALLGTVGQGVALASLATSGAFAGRVLHGGLAGSNLWSLYADGLAVPLVALTVFTGLAAIAASWKVDDRPAAHFALLQLLQAALAGVFLAENVVLFYLAWESVLIPMFFLIGGWGSSNRRHAAMKFLVYTFAGGALLLVGIIATVVETGQLSIPAIAQAASAVKNPTLVFWLLTLGFLVKLPAVPLHTWLPDAHTEAPTAGSIVLAGVLLKMGGYGLIRMSIAFAPSAFSAGRPILAALGIVGIVYGAAMALVQTDLKRLVAYSSVAHMGFVLLAVASATAAGLSAALITMVSHGLVAPLLFFLVGAVYERTHTRELARLGGLGAVVPKWSVALVFAALASLGLPGLSGFPGEFATLLESVKAFGGWTAVVGAGLALSAAYNLRAVRESVQGPVGEFARLDDLDARETLVVAVFAVAIVALGVYPGLVLTTSHRALAAILTMTGGL